MTSPAAFGLFTGARSPLDAALDALAASAAAQATADAAKAAAATVAANLASLGNIAGKLIGYVQIGSYTANPATTSPSDTEQVITTMTLPNVTQDRAVLLTNTPLEVYTTSGSSARVYTRYTLSGATPDTSSGVLFDMPVSPTTPTWSTSVQLTMLHKQRANVTNRIAWTVLPTNGSHGASIYLMRPVYFLAFDMGPFPTAPLVA